MNLTTEKKQEIFETHGRIKSKTDTGSAESQIALFTHRINHISGHLKVNKKDFSAELSLVELQVVEKLLTLGLITTEQAMEMTDLTPNGSEGIS